MCKKTVLRRLCKLIDLNFDTAEAMQAFEDGSDFDVKKHKQEPERAVDVFDTEAKEIKDETDGQ
jgi:recombination protein RecT